MDITVYCHVQRAGAGESRASLPRIAHLHCIYRGIRLAPQCRPHLQRDWTRPCRICDLPVVTLKRKTRLEPAVPRAGPGKGPLGLRYGLQVRQVQKLRRTPGPRARARASSGVGCRSGQVSLRSGQVRSGFLLGRSLGSDHEGQATSPETVTAMQCVPRGAQSGVELAVPNFQSKRGLCGR